MQIQTKRIMISSDNDALDIMELVNDVLSEYETRLQFVNDNKEYDGYEIYHVVYKPEPRQSPPFLGCERETIPLSNIYHGLGLLPCDGLTPETVARLEAEKAA